jgi:hypothetical protein
MVKISLGIDGEWNIEVSLCGEKVLLRLYILHCIPGRIFHLDGSTSNSLVEDIPRSIVVQ